jgi:hypothetical protein
MGERITQYLHNASATCHMLPIFLVRPFWVISDVDIVVPFLIGSKTGLGRPYFGCISDVIKLLMVSYSAEGASDTYHLTAF